MTYIAHPINEEQEKAVKAILDALKVPYDTEPDLDETQHLFSTEANREALNESLSQIEHGKTVEIKLDQIWK